MKVRGANVWRKDRIQRLYVSPSVTGREENAKVGSRRGDFSTNASYGALSRRGGGGARRLAEGRTVLCDTHGHEGACLGGSTTVTCVLCVYVCLHFCERVPQLAA